MNERWFAAVEAALRRRLVRVVVAIVGLVIVTRGVMMGGLSAGAAWTEILGFLLTMVSLVRGNGTSAKLSEDQLRLRLRSEVRTRWRAEAKTRGLLKREYVPLHLIADEIRSDADIPTARKTGIVPASWATAQFKQAAVDLYLAAPDGRLIITGQRGSGKSILSVMITLGILDPDAAEIAPQMRVPLPISISSWRPSQESFTSWFDRRLVRAYPTIRLASQVTSKGPVFDLIITGKYLPILDGMDEIPASERGKAAQQLAEYFSDGVPVVILTREVADLRGAFPNIARRHIAPVSADEAARYFDYLQERHGIPTGALSANLRRGVPESLSSLLKRPLYLDLIESALTARQVTTTQLVASASVQGARELEKALVRCAWTAPCAPCGQVAVAKPAI